MNKFIAFGCTLLILGGCATTGTEPAADGGDVFSLVNSADRAYSQGNWKEAETGYRDVIAKVPTDAYAYFRLGNSLAKQFRFDDAAQAYQESLVHDANKTKVYHNLAMIHLLQAENSLNAGLKTIPEKDGNAAQVKHMLLQLKKITRISLQEVPSPVSSAR